MENDRLPYISVIITAYNRKEFLLNAIKSAINQTLDKKYYEIIVIKNFEDKNIDEFIDNHNIQKIFIDGTMGEFIYSGLTKSSGQIVSFLDDDDLFSDDKLEIVYNKFKSNNNLCYYHNSNIPLNNKYQELYITSNPAIGINKSSISVKKSILNMNNLKRIDFCDDEYMYLSALESDKDINADKEKLTYNMLHNSTTNINTENIREFIRFKLIINEQVIKNFMIFKEIFISNKANNYVKKAIMFLEIYSYIYGNNVKPRNLLDIVKNRDVIFSKIFIAYILVRIHPNFRYIVIKKLMNNDKKI